MINKYKMTFTNWFLFSDKEKKPGDILYLNSDPKPTGQYEIKFLRAKFNIRFLDCPKIEPISKIIFGETGKIAYILKEDDFDDMTYFGVSIKTNVEDYYCEHSIEELDVKLELFKEFIKNLSGTTSMFEDRDIFNCRS